MRALLTRKPDITELKPIGIADLVQRFSNGLENLDQRIWTLGDPQLDQAFTTGDGVGEWPCRVLVGHLADAELAFVHRMRRIVAEERPLFAVWDENAFIEAGLYGNAGNRRSFPVREFLETLQATRKWTASWLKTLPDSAFARTGQHPERGEQTLRTVLEYATWHLEQHGWFLNQKIRKLFS
ncbi:MAG: DinB family protein [Leptospirales bacterium]|nr:DinB family protein [Leptospirales bacterium]